MRLTIGLTSMSLRCVFLPTCWHTSILYIPAKFQQIFLAWVVLDTMSKISALLDPMTIFVWRHLNTAPDARLRKLEPSWLQPPQLARGFGLMKRNIVLRRRSRN